MKIARILRNGQTEYAIVEDDLIYPCGGDPFTGSQGQAAASTRIPSRCLPRSARPILFVSAGDYKGHADRRARTTLKRHCIPQSHHLSLGTERAIRAPGSV